MLNKGVRGMRLTKVFALIQERLVRPKCLTRVRRLSRRSHSDSAAMIEKLEPRCLLTTIDLATLGAAGITIFGADAVDQSGFSVSSAGGRERGRLRRPADRCPLRRCVEQRQIECG